MADFNLDRIRFRWKGEWISSTDYVKDDIVLYQGKSYVCLIGHTSDDTFFYNDLENASPKWELMFDGFEWRGDWTVSTYYTEGEIVKFKGYLYQCIESHTSTNITTIQLPADASKWKIVAIGYNWLNLWDVNTNYDLGDVVRYNGRTYVCSTSHRSATTTVLGLEDDISNWTIVSTSDSWQADWAPDTRYKVQDIVKYGAISYRCIEAHTSAETTTIGLEADQNKWEIFLEGIEYKGEWTGPFRYKRFDVVKSGGSLWRANTGHTSTTSLRADQSNWDIFVPGLEFERGWIAGEEYNKGDIVRHSGYTYVALTNNTNSVPSVNGILQDTGDWELLVAGYRMRGDWIDFENYLTGDVVRDQGYLYVAIADNSGVHPDSSASTWTVLVTGRKWKDNWEDDQQYSLGDVVTYAGVAYICIQRHQATASDSRPDLDVLQPDQNYWRVLLQGTPSNVLTTQGDIRTHDDVSTTRFAIGSPGASLTSIAGNVSWQDFEDVPNVFYVSNDGLDSPTNGISINAPFKTLKYACQHVQNNFDTDTVNTTIFVKTGIYKEILPIKIPRNCAVVGDELRSTVIMPAETFEGSDMFYVNNGAGLRNMTLQGLTGTLGAANLQGTRIPTGGAFVSLDPGTGPADSSVWITNKSPYVQNVTTFGTACIGTKIDGTLHNGGNKSIVANDFTQIISDGIGYWANEAGRSELVSVFTYFCYIGYFATNGGILRATNGNNSYGTFGSRAEGFSLFETPITAEVDNQTQDAQVEVVHTRAGTEILAVGYSHAGQEYSTASGTISGTGINAAPVYSEFRNGAISQIRIIDPADSSTPGGINYQYLLNTAQGGDDVSILLSAADDFGTSQRYVGMRIFIDSGKGVGQYGYITEYNEVTKKALVTRESDNGAGWDHIYPGYPIEDVLDSTTRYRIEPAVNIAEPTFSTTALNTGLDAGSYKFVASDGDQKILVVSSDRTDDYAYSTDGGETWINDSNTVIGAGSGSITGAVWTGREFVVTTSTTFYAKTIGGSLTTWGSTLWGTGAKTGVASDGNGKVIVIDSAGNVQYSADHLDTVNLGTAISGKPAFGNGKFIIINNSGDVAYSTDGGATWTTTTSALSADTWNSVVYGDGKFVAIASNNKVAYSHDGITWYENTIEDVDTFDTVSYGAGVFVATGTSSKFAKSQDGKVWLTYQEDSSSYNLDSTRTWGQMQYMPLQKNWIAVANGATWNTVQLGATAFARVLVSSSRIQSFIIYNPGSNYLEDPLISVFDPEATIFVDFDARIFDGVLAQPEFTNRGEGYVTATMSISGNGYADIYQEGKRINLKNVSLVPGPGANVVFDSIDDVNYRLTKIISQSGTAPNFDLVVEVSPPITNQNSPEHEESLILRELYSQVRLTGHDFLDIGTGNVNSTRYPDLYVEGVDSLNEPQPFNEVTEFNGGRVFYTSTDQDGNFRVGELFAVEQATGIVSINADFFELSGLEELSLGAIQVGGSAVVIREFSKEPTFAANSNNIVPTQAAIIKYLEGRISGGGADAVTNALIAGQVRISGTGITTTSGLELQIPVTVNMAKGIDGDYLAHQFFLSKK